MFRRVVLAILAFSLVFALAACDEKADESVSAEGGAATLGAPSPAQGLLTLEDVERVTGLSDLRAVPYDAKSTVLYGDVNITDAAGNAVAIVVVGDSENWDEWLTDGYSVSEPVTPPVGEESFLGPSPDVSPVLTLFAFRKGATAVMIETGLDANGEPVLGTEQLRALAEVVVARL